MADLYGNISISGGKKAPPPQPPRKQDDPPKEQPRHSGTSIKKRYILVPLSVLVLLAGYYGLSTTLIPFYLKDKFPDVFYDRTGLVLTIKAAVFNPLECSLNLEGIEIQKQKNDETREDFLTVRNLYINLDFVSLLRNSFVSDSLLVKGANFTLFRYADGSYNVSQFFAKASDRPSEMLNFAALPFFYSLNNISISDSSIHFNDVTTEKVHQVESLSLNLPTLANFSYNAGNYIQPRFSAIINGSPVELISETDGSSAFKSGDTPTRLSSTLNAIDLPLYSNYLPVPLPVLIEKGQADAKIEISFLPQGSKGRQLIFNYQFQITDSLWQSRDGTLSLAIPMLTVSGTLDPFKSDLGIESLLLRDPLLSFGKNFSKETIDSLFLQGYDKNGTNGIPVDLPALTVNLLIVDNGGIQVATEENDLVLGSIQLSVRNFANSAALRRNGPSTNSSFQISGELENNFSMFSWRGVFENTIPTGNIEINNLPIAMALRAIAPQSSTPAQGNADIRGRLSLRRAESAPVSITFAEGLLDFTSISLGEKDNPWLRGSSGKIAVFLLQDNTIEIDSFFLEKGKLRFAPHRLPPLLQTFMDAKESSIKNIDFKGELVLLPDEEKHPAIHFEDVHLQTAGLSTAPPQDNNFTFSGNLRNSGSLKAKGKLSLAPLDGSIETAFAKLPATLLLQGDKSDFLKAGPDTLVNGTGIYHIKEKNYEGAIEIENGSFTYGPEQRRFDFAQAAFAQISTDGKLKNSSCRDVLFKTVSLEGAGYQLASAGISLSSLTRNGDDLAIGDLVFSGTEVSTRSDLGTLFEPLLTKRAGSFHLQSLRMNGKVNLEQDTSANSVAIDDFDLQISSLTTNGSAGNDKPGKTGTIAFTAISATQGKVAGKGKLALYPLQTQLDLSLTGTDSALFLNLFQPTSTDLVEAVIDGQVSYSYPAQVTTGKIMLAEGKLYSSDGDDWITWQDALLDDFQYRSDSSHLTINRLTLTQPHFRQPLGGSDFYHIIRDALLPSARRSSPSPASFLQNLDIGHAAIEEGQLQYRDARISPPWQSEISSIDGTITNFSHSSSQTRMDYNLSGTVGGAPFTAKGAARPTEDGVEETVSLELSRLPLEALQEQLSTNIDLEYENSLLDVYFQKDKAAGPSFATFTLASGAALASDSPTALTIALLSDRKERLRESVMLTDPDRPVFEQAVHHFQKQVIKSTVSPYLLLPEPYNLLGQNSTITFQPGTTELSDDGRRNLSLFGMLLTDYPLLKLIPAAVINPTTDGEALRRMLEQKENERIRLENNRLLLQWQQEHAEKAETPTENESIVEGIVEKDLQEFTPITARPVTVDTTMLEQIGRQRLETVRDYLLQEHDIVSDNISSAEHITIEEKTPGVDLHLSHIGATKD